MNRHLKIAFFVAPLLTIIAYILTGYFTDSKAQRSAQSKMTLLGSCQPAENACVFMLGELELKLISNVKKQQQQLAIISNKPITHLSVALGLNNNFKQFVMMKSDDGKYWQIKPDKNDDILKFKQIRLAFKYMDSPSYAEAEVQF